MREYLVSALTATVLGGFFIALCHGKYKKVTSVAVGVLILVIFLSPIPSLGESLSGLTSGVPTIPDGDGFNGYEKVASESFIKGIRKAVANDYRLKEENIEVRINGFTLNTMRADEIYIVLYGYAVLSDTSRIKEFVDKNFLNEGGYSEVGIEIG